GVFASHFTQDAHAKAGSRERMTEDHFARQAQRQAELAHFVLEQLPQRLEELEMQRFRQPADIVMRLDRMRLFGFRARRFDYVRIDRALREPPGIESSASERLGFGLKDMHEFTADDPAFLLRISHAGKLAEKCLAGIDVTDFDAEVSADGV